MSQYLANKRIVLGVTGSIAAYKSADLIRRLREEGALVRVVMTEHAKRFITPLTLQALSGHPIHDDLFDLEAEAAMGHIELARWAELILVAPGSAGFMARLCVGNADDLLTTLCLATHAPIMIAPAMNQNMWLNAITQENVSKLRQKQIQVLDTGAGSQACGEVGPGRMLEPVEIREAVKALFSQKKRLAGLNILITAGPTQEAIDPIRYISNNSSGKMGYALAKAAIDAGALVTLISGPVHLAPPSHAALISVVTAAEMHAAVMQYISACDIFISVAAVSDYRCETVSEQKIHKKEARTQLNLIRTADIVAEVAQLPNKPFIVGFAAETENVVENAQEKLLRKNLDMIIANQVGNGSGMGSDDNEVTVISQKSKVQLTLNSKTQLSSQLIQMIADTYFEKEACHERSV